MRVPVSLAAAAVTLTAATSALAQAPERWTYPAACKEVGAAESDQGHALFLAAKVKADNGKYEAALEDYIAAYGKDCTKAQILVTISKTHELNGDRKEAIRAIELYLLRKPDAEDAATQRNRLASLKEKLAEEGKAGGGAKVGDGGAKVGDGKGKGVEEPPATDKGHGPGVGPWVVVGAGGAALVTGVVLLAATSYPSGCDAATSKCTVPNGPNAATILSQKVSDANAARTKKTVGGVLTGVGVAGVGAGLAWYFLTKSHEKSSTEGRIDVAPSFAPGYGGIAASGRF